MPNPTLSDVHADRPLTDISVAWAQNPANFVSRQVFPVVGSPNKSNTYYVWDKDDFRRTDAKLRAEGTVGPKRNLRLSTDSFICDVYSIGMGISEQTAANADSPLDLEATFALMNAQDLAIREEILFTSAAFTTSVWDTDVTGGTNFTVWNDAASTPIENVTTGIKTVLKNTGFRPNTLVMGADVWYDGLMNHPDIIGRLADNAPRLVNRQFVANLFELDRVIVGQASYNSAEEEVTASEAFLLGKHALLAYVNPTPALNAPSAGYTFVWSGFIGNTAGIKVKRYDIPEADAYPMIESFTAVDHKPVAGSLGYFFSGAVT